MRPSSLVTIAWRNLLRNPQRTGLTVAAIGLGLAALIGLWGFSEGLQQNLAGNLQDTIVGSFQVHRQGFFRRPELHRDIGEPQPVVEHLGAAGVERWTWRLEAFGLAAGPRGAAGVLLIGMDPAREPRVTRFPEKVTGGRFLDGADAQACVIGAGLARSLGVGVGDDLAVAAYDRFGALVAEELQVVGIVATGELGIDRGLAVVPLVTLQALLEMEGRVTSVVARVAGHRLDRTVAGLRASLGPLGLDVLRWHEMFPVVQQWIDLSDGFHYILLATLLAIVLGGVVNTVLISALERTRELGVLMALGMRAGQVRTLVAAEALTLGALGTLAGALLGVGTTVWLGRTGVDLSAFLGSTSRFYIDPVIRPELDPWNVLAATSAAFLTSALAAAYPALVAARLDPLEAMRHG